MAREYENAESRVPEMVWLGFKSTNVGVPRSLGNAMENTLISMANSGITKEDTRNCKSHPNVH